MKPIKPTVALEVGGTATSSPGVHWLAPLHLHVVDHPVLGALGAVQLGTNGPTGGCRRYEKESKKRIAELYPLPGKLYIVL